MPKAVCVILIGVGLCVGCADQNAVGHREVRQKFVATLALIATANQGFVPEGNEIEVRLKVGDQEVTQTRRDLQAFRQKVLADSVVSLRSISGIGSPSQQVATRRLLADVYASQARYDLREAMANWANISDRSAVLISLLSAVDRADSRVRLFDTDDRPLLAQLEQDRRETLASAEAIEKEAQTLRSESESLAGGVTELASESKQASGEAHRLTGVALVTTDSDQQYELYDRSAAADRRANIASAAAGKLGVKLDVINSELALLVKRSRIAQEAIETLDKQIAAARQRQARGPYQQAVAEKAQAVDQLVASLGRITQQYAVSVERQLEQAAAKIRDAIDQVAVVQSDAGPLIRIEQLGHMTEMTHLLTEHILVAASHGTTLGVIAQQAGSLMPGQAAAFRGKANRLYTKQRKLIESAKQMISDASASCDQLGRELADSDPLARSAKQQAQRLERYRVLIDQQRLAAPPSGQG